MKVHKRVHFFSFSNFQSLSDLKIFNINYSSCSKKEAVTSELFVSIHIFWTEKHGRFYENMLSNWKCYIHVITTSTWRYGWFCKVFKDDGYILDQISLTVLSFVVSDYHKIQKCLVTYHFCHQWHNISCHVTAILG